MDDDSLTILQRAADAHGVCGHEDEVRELIREYLEPVCAEIKYDKLGSIICEKPGQADSPRIALDAHMDEVGFMVKLVTDEGFVRFTTLGGWVDQVLLAQRVVIKTAKGKIPGIIGSKPPHLLPPDKRRQMIKKEAMFIDVGARSKEQAEKEFGIRPGDPITPDSSFRTLADQGRLLGKAWDDRVGVALMIDAIRRLGDDHPNTVVGVGAVMEERGLLGAITSSHVSRPDAAIILESSIAGDMPGVKAYESPDKLGAGPSIIFHEAGIVPPRRFRELALKTAEELNIPVQHGFLERGATDAGRIHIHAEGVPTLTLCVPARYIHSHTQIIDASDYDNALKLVLALLKKLDAQTVKSLTQW